MYKDRWKLMTANETYQLCGYRTVKAFRLAAQQGFIPRVLVGKRVLFDLEQLKEWAAKGGTPLKTDNAEPQTARAAA